MSFLKQYCWKNTTNYKPECTIPGYIYYYEMIDMEGNLIRFIISR